MAKYAVELRIVNSGSPNDIPCDGAASECYLAVGSITPGASDDIAVTTLFVKDAGNRKCYSQFIDAKTGKQVNAIEIDDNPAAALILTFSVFWGSRIFDSILAAVAEKAVGVAFGSVYTQVAAGMVGDLIKDRLSVFEKRLTARIAEDAASFVDTIAVETYDHFGSLIHDGKVTLKIRSDIDRQETFLDVPVIASGDPVAEVVLKRIG